MNRLSGSNEDTADHMTIGIKCTNVSENYSYTKYIEGKCRATTAK